MEVIRGQVGEIHSAQRTPRPGPWSRKRPIVILQKLNGGLEDILGS